MRNGVARLQNRFYRGLDRRYFVRILKGADMKKPRQLAGRPGLKTKPQGGGSQMDSNHGKKATQGVSDQIAAGRQYVQKHGASAVLSIIRRCVAPAPLGKLAVQFHDVKTESRGVREQRTPLELKAWFTEQGAIVQPDKEQQPLLVLDLGRDNRKRKEHVLSRQLLFLDHDERAPSVDRYVELLEPLGLAFVAHQSWSHTEDAPRTHGLLFLAEPIVYSADRDVDVVRHEQNFIGGVFAELLDAELDSSHWTPGRAVYAGNRPSEAAPARRVVGQDGGGLRWDALLQDLGYEPPVDLQLGPPRDDDEDHPLPTADELRGKHPDSDRLERFKTYLSTCAPCVEGMKPDGAGAHLLYIMRAGIRGLLLDKGVVVDTVFNSPWNRRCKDKKGGKFPWTLSQLVHKADDAEKDNFDKPPGWLLIERDEEEEEDEDKVDDFSHLHITQEFIATFGDDVRYLTDLGQWAAWTGSHWHIGGDSDVRQKLSTICNKMAKEALSRGERGARAANREAAESGEGEEDSKGDCAEAKRIRRNAAATAKSLRDGTLIGKVLLKLAQEPTLRKMRSDFDQDEMLLACPNLTVDLRDGGKEWKPRREDYLTQCASVDPDFKMPIPTWERVQSIAFRRTRVENEEVQARYDAAEHTKYINRCLGFALTGSLAEHALFIWHGAGENFKGTQLNTVNSILGPAYCATLNRTTITKQLHGEKHSQDIATREYKRMVITDEIDNTGAELDVGRIKQLVSSDPVYARGMRENDRPIAWRAKIFSPQNVPATIKNPGRNIERRLHYVPFCVPSREQADDFIPHIDQKLRAERPGILALLIRSAREWNMNFKENGQGLRPPEWVIYGSREFIRNGDLIKAFFDDLYVADPKGRIKPKDLHDAYKNYMFHEHGVRFDDCHNSDAFGKLMRSGSYPVEAKTVNGKKYYVGIRLNDIAARKAEQKRKDDARDAETA